VPGAVKTLKAYDFGFATGVPQRQIQELASLGYAKRTDNDVVLLGASEVDEAPWRLRSAYSPHCGLGRYASPQPPRLMSASEKPTSHLMLVSLVTIHIRQI
jgi:hypothetical protein